MSGDNIYCNIMMVDSLMIACLVYGSLIILHVAMAHPRSLSRCLAQKTDGQIYNVRLLGQLDENAKNYPRAEAIRNGCKISMANAAWRYPLYVSEFFKKRAESFMATVVKKALGIDHYWGSRVELAPGRGAIHLHMIRIARGKAYLRAFYQGRTSEEKAEVLDKYA
jgi:hypothetical protein